jgi:quercetin dioxygenase-like cupin family protein
MDGQATVLLRHAIAAELQWEAFGKRSEAHERVLWAEDPVRAAALHLRPGASNPPHTHRDEVHHIWVVSGSCTLDGHPLYGGSYVFVPVGVEHGEKAGIEGCTLFYLTLPASIERRRSERPAPREPEAEKKRRRSPAKG